MAEQETLLAAVAKRVRQAPQAMALAAQERSIDYGSLWRRVTNAAGFLRETGVRPGERILLSATSTGPSFVFGYLACHLAGCIAVPIDPQTPRQRLEHIIKRVRPARIFLQNTKGADRDDISSIEELDRDDVSGDGNSFTFPEPEGIADILFTTGTTGEPKGVLLTHRNILCAARNINAFIGNGCDDREVVPLPLSHSFGLGRLRCNLLAGGAIILAPGFAFPGMILRELEKWQATGFSSVPSGFAVLLRMGDNALGQFRSHLRYIEIGSAPMPSEHKEKLMEILPNTRICMHYGLTEASRSCFVEFHESADRLHSIGKPSPGVEAAILDEDGHPVPLGTAGRIVLRGGHVMKGYFEDPTATDEVLAEGWIRTGDYGRQDAAGYLYLEAREKELINVGGRKVAPLEIEACLAAHPAIKACACIGIADPDGITGEAIKAFLVPESGAADRPGPGILRAFIKDRLEAYKIPAHFEWIDAIPTSNSGKIQCLALKDHQGGQNQ